MKARPPEVPPPAFPDQNKTPSARELGALFGEARSPGEALMRWLRETHPDAVLEWSYSSRCGWYLIGRLKKRRLFYLLPRRKDSELRLILGAKAIASLATTPHAAAVKRLLATAQRYPEGTLFVFPADRFDSDLAIALLQSKLAH